MTTPTQSAAALVRAYMNAADDHSREMLTWLVDGKIVAALLVLVDVQQEALEIVRDCPPEALHLMPMAASAALALTETPDAD